MISLVRIRCRVFGKPRCAAPRGGGALPALPAPAWPCWPSCGLGFVVALVEVALFDFLGRLVDLARDVPAPDFFARHGRELAFMAFVALVARPLLIALSDLLVHQAVTPGLTARIRWQQHQYVVRQSLSFFQNDYAGRIANRIMQTGASLRESAVQIVDALWYVSVYTGSALFLFAQADWRLTLPLIVWVFLYIGALAFFVPRVKQRSWKASEARSALMGRIVDGYTNIATLKLFAHTRQEDAYVAEAVQENVDKVRGMTRMTTGMDVTLTGPHGLLVVVTAGLGCGCAGGTLSARAPSPVHRPGDPVENMSAGSCGGQRQSSRTSAPSRTEWKPVPGPMR